MREITFTAYFSCCVSITIFMALPSGSQSELNRNLLKGAE